MAEIDVAQSTARASAELGLVRPELVDSGARFANGEGGGVANSNDDNGACVLQLEECRHLLVEDFCLTRGTSAFVPNDVLMRRQGQDNCWFVTGPNMGGKSTFLRSVAHAVCLAQVRSVRSRQYAIQPLATGARRRRTHPSIHPFMHFELTARVCV